jgi:hypothetical protein
MYLAQQEELYPVPNNPIKEVPNVNSNNFDLGGVFSLNNTVYYFALFALIWTIYYFFLHQYQFKYFTSGNRAKEYANEWKGLKYLVTCYRISWTLLALQFPLIFFYIGSGDTLSSIVFGTLFFIFFFLKILLDMTHLFKISDYFKSYQNLPLGEQIKVFLTSLASSFQASKKPADKPSAKPGSLATKK